MEPCNLGVSLREAIGQAQNLAGERKIRMETDIKDQAIVVSGDADALRRLVFILLENAIKYNVEGGAVRISLALQAGHAVCSVTDSGIGIDGGDLDHMFDRFWRADKVRSRGGGAGLGLSIARWIVESHQGTIEVRSEVARGTTFTVRLPAIRVSSQEA
jgi:signal transduction histidine kinase